DDVARLPSLYRDVCADLARAQAARYGAPLVDELQALVASAHAVLYRASIRSRDGRGRVLLAPFVEFPRAVRRHWRAMLIAALLFFAAILGYVASQGSGGNIVTFVVGHGSLELGAIVLCGGAGLAMGWSIVAPGDRTRVASLRAVGPDVATIIGGAAVMLAMAAG